MRTSIRGAPTGGGPGAGAVVMLTCCTCTPRQILTYVFATLSKDSFGALSDLRGLRDSVCGVTRHLDVPVVTT